MYIYKSTAFYLLSFAAKQQDENFGWDEVFFAPYRSYEKTVAVFETLESKEDTSRDNIGVFLIK